jgi:cob(I)alamin adenosyltransferase
MTMPHDETRKYIHELANQLFVIDASVSRALSILDKKSSDQSEEEITRLRKAAEYLKKSIVTINDLRSHIHAQIQQGK